MLSLESLSELQEPRSGDCFCMAEEHILGYLVPYIDVKGNIKERRYNQSYFATIKYELQNYN